MKYHELPKQSKGIALITIVNFYIKIAQRINENPEIADEIETDGKIMPDDLYQLVNKYKDSPFVVNKIYNEYKDFFIAQLEAINFKPDGDVID